MVTAFSLSYSGKAQTSNAANFSVRYNFLYNANELLDQYQRDIVPTPQEDYDKLLPVFISYAEKPDLMNKVMTKAKTIIIEKGNSKYMGLAHLLMARAAFNKGDYMIAIAYSDDIINDYANDKEINAGAMVVKARALFAIHDIENGCRVAAQVSEQAPTMIDMKVEAYAVAAQGAIYKGNWNQALSYLGQAIKYSHTAEEKSRMHFVSAQLLEKTRQPQLAAEQYKKAKSTAAFEELRLNAIIREMELNPSAQQYENGVPEDLTRLLKQKQYQDYQDQLFYTIGKYEEKAGNTAAALAHYLQAAKINGSNALLKSNAYARAADLQLRISKEYDQASANYTQAMSILPKSYNNYSQQRYKLKYSKEISERYQALAKADTSGRDIAPIPYNDQIVTAYYDIATMYFQDLQDSVEAEKVYTQINTRFPKNKLSKSVDYALNLLKSRPGGMDGKTYAIGNDFLTKHAQREFAQAITEAALLNRDRNRKLERDLQFYDEGSSAEKPAQEIASTLAPLQPHTLSLAKPVTSIAAAPILSPVAAPLSTSKSPGPQINFSKENELASYYFMIAVEDGSLNMSPSRFGVGEFNRSRYAESNLRHRLLEFEKTQVIYVGVFNSLTAAKAYAAEITPQLKSIMKTAGAKYSSSIISKENLEKLESDEIYRVYEDFSNK